MAKNMTTQKMTISVTLHRSVTTKPVCRDMAAQAKRRAGGTSFELVMPSSMNAVAKVEPSRLPSSW